MGRTALLAIAAAAVAASAWGAGDSRALAGDGQAGLGPPIRIKARVITPFESCLARIDRIAAEMGEPDSIIDTDDVRKVRFGEDGNAVMVKCVRADAKMTVVRSPSP